MSSVIVCIESREWGGWRFVAGEVFNALHLLLMLKHTVQK